MSNVEAMVQKLRSEIHMNRYSKSIKLSETILNLLSAESSKEEKLHQTFTKVSENVREEMLLVKELEEMISGKSFTEMLQENSMPKMSEKMTEKIEEKDEREGIQEGKWGKKSSVESGEVGKWGKKKQSSQWMKKYDTNPSVLTMSDTFANTNQLKNEPDKPKEVEIAASSLDSDEIEILQRETILPINLPEFFKNKESHRLIICYYEKCRDILSVLVKEIVGKKEVIELEGLEKLVVGEGKEKTEGIKIYVGPFESGFEHNICSLLGNSKNLLVLYGEKDRKVMTEKVSNLRNEGYSLTF